MRYSRFKKQMDGTAAVRRPRGPNSPRKKVEKKTSPRKSKSKSKAGKEEEDDEDHDGEKVKLEVMGMGSASGSRQGTVESDAGSERMEKRVKLEPGVGVASSSEALNTPQTMPGTPSEGSRFVREASASPSPGPSERFDGAGEIGEMDEMGFSFGMHGEEAGIGGLYAPMMGEGMGGGFGMGMGMQMGLGDPFEGLWQGGGGMQVGEGGVHVKTEPRWEEAYRHV
jgi:hypothetical protein